MANETSEPQRNSAPVQYFDIAQALQEADGRSEAIPGRVDMATSSNCYIAFFRTRPRGGETHVLRHVE